jgi:hypothetical protein
MEVFILNFDFSDGIKVMVVENEWVRERRKSDVSALGLIWLNEE